MRRLPADETELWRRVVRDVAPLPRRAPTPGRVPPAAETSERLPPARIAGTAGETLAVQPRLRHPPLPPPPDPFAGVDRRTAERVRRGQYPVEARLDLHGLTQLQAHRALSGFVAAARGAGQRCVLVITGHGRTTGGGILKAAAPRWLAEPALRAHVLLLAAALPQHGGAGALYVLLRRPGR
jgi:DNA-nicking Smr family endonuclease